MLMSVKNRLMSVYIVLMRVYIVLMIVYIVHMGVNFVLMRFFLHILFLLWYWMYSWLVYSVAMSSFILW